VNPGFGGQHFIANVLDKIRKARTMIDRLGHSVLLEVDGGVKVDNAGTIVAAGADILVAGSAIFEAPGCDYRNTIARMRAAGNAGGSQVGGNGQSKSLTKSSQSSPASSRKARR